MSLAIIVSGVVRNMIEASSSWRFHGDYFLIGDENIYKRRALKPRGKLITKINKIIKKTKVDFESITIPSKKSIISENEHYYDSIFHMLWKWKCAYYLIQPYHEIKKYEKILLIRPDVYFRYINKNQIDDLIVLKNTIHCMVGPHNVIRDNIERQWFNDFFLFFDMETFKIISKAYDSYCENHEFIIEVGHDIHVFFGEFLKENLIEFKDGLNKFIDFVVLNDSICEKFFDNGILKEGYQYKDITKDIK